MENGNFRLFAANEKRKRQTSVCFLQVVFLGANDHGKRCLLFQHKCPFMLRSRGASKGFYHFPLLLRRFINTNRNAVLQKKLMEIYMFLPIGTDANLSCLLLAGSRISQIFHYIQPIETFPQRYQFYLGIFQRLSNGLKGTVQRDLRGVQRYIIR